MNATVTPLYRRGRPNKKVRPVTGDLNLAESTHFLTGRLVTTACIVNEQGLSLIPDLLNARVSFIAADGFKLCGTELVCAEYYQEWWIRLVDKGTV